MAASAIACSAPDDDGDAKENNGNLIGGATMADGDLPSTLFIKDTCTASKVGPRHIILAAHCVWGDNAFNPKFADGQPLTLTSHARAVSGAYENFTIKHTSVGEEWVERCSGPDTTCHYVGYDNANRPADVAVIETVEEITSAATGAVDIDPMPPGEAVIVTGMGCESSVGGYWPYSSAQLKAGVVQLLPGTALLHSGSSVTLETLPVIAAHDLITPGPAWPIPGPGLCPGDSGGPLYRASSGGRTVVGVNGSYTFTGPGGGIPVTNWHTRLDTATPRNIAAWLQKTGVNTCGGGTCPTMNLSAKLDGNPPAPGVTADLVSDGRDNSCEAKALDSSTAQSLINGILGSGNSAACLTMDATRVSVDDSYAYRATVWCSLKTPPTEAQKFGFTQQMQLRGYPNYAFSADGRSIVGSLRTPKCDSFPTGDEACRQTLPSKAKMEADIQRSSNTEATCTLGQPVAASGYYYVQSTCTLKTALPAAWTDYFTQSMQRLRYNASVNGDTVTVVGFSMSCGVFSGGQ